MAVSQTFLDAVCFAATTGGRADEMRRFRFVCRDLMQDDGLLLSSMDVEFRGAGRTLLLSACARGDLPLVQRLCRLGANLGDRTHPSFAPLRMAVSKGYTKIASELRHSYRTRETPSPPISKALLAIGIASSVGFGHDVKKCVLLNHAFSRSALLWKGLVNMPLRSYDTGTLLIAAAQTGDVARITTLIDQGARIDTVSGINNALHAAGMAGHSLAASTLLAHGASMSQSLVNEISGPSPSRWTALHLAAMHRGDPVVAAHLLLGGASLNAATSWGNTPLHFACIFDNLQAVQLLCEAGADLFARDGMGLCPLQLCNEGEVKAFVASRMELVQKKVLDSRYNSGIIGGRPVRGSLDRDHPAAKWVVWVSHPRHIRALPVGVAWYADRDKAKQEANRLANFWTCGGPHYYNSCDGRDFGGSDDSEERAYKPFVIDYSGSGPHSLYVSMQFGVNILE